MLDRAWLAASAVSTPWLVLLIIDLLVGITMAALYVREVRGERRADKLSWYRRRAVPLAGLALIVAIRAFVTKA